MKKFTRPILVLILAVLAFASSVQANSSLQSIRISDKNTDQLVVSFSAPVSLTSAHGFRLIGGSSRIERLLSGSGTTQLVFQLTDHVLPDDRFEFLYWSELGNARIASKKMGSIEKISANNAINEYQGGGQLYYVSTGGSDNNSGKSKDQPFRTINKAQSVVQPGDYILLKRGDVFGNTYIMAQKSGSEGNYITFAAYGSGNKPVIEHDNVNTFTIADKSYIQVDNLHFKTNGSGETGVYIIGDSKYPVVSNCRIEGQGKPHYGVNYGISDGAAKAVVYPQVLNNYITGFRWNIRSSGYPYNGTHEVIGGIIENNRCADNRTTDDGDGISAQRGKYHGLIIRKNEISGYYDDGIDLYAADNIIAEYNTVHSPQQPSSSGQGIKAGGITRTEPVVGHQSTNIIIRYNTVYNIYNRVNDSGSQNGIQTNDGASGKLYGNLVYDVGGHGIIVSGPVDNWEVHHNTVINAGKDGLQLYTEGANGGNVAIRNNILEGKDNDLRCMIRNGGENAVGERNILLSKAASGQYEGRNDMRARKEDLFVSSEKDDYRLKVEAMAIDAGVTIKSYIKSYRGFAIKDKHDIGAFEFGGSSSAPAPAPAPAPTPEPPAPAPAPSPAPAPAPIGDNGLNYRYYEGEWSELPDFSALTARKEGQANGFDLSVRQREDKFGIVYYGSIQIDKGGEYTFYTKSDDGSTLLIDGKLVVDNDGLHAPLERSGKVKLTSGRHTIEVRFFERYQGQVLEIRYAASGISKQRIPLSKLYFAGGDTSPEPTPQPTPPADDQPVAAEPGIRYKYYEGRWGSLPNFGSMSVIKSGTLSNFSLSPARTDRYFGLVYEGFIKIDNSGEYTFYTSSDDGSKLYINGQQLVDNDGVHAARERSGKVHLSAGYHKIEVRYFENAYGEELKVSYQGPGVSKRTIPNAVLLLDKPSNTKTAGTAIQKSGGESTSEVAASFANAGFAKIYPNPARETVNVEMNAQDTEVTITLKNMAGYVLYQKTVHDTLLKQTEQINLSALSIKSGMYIIQVEGDQVGTHSFRLIRE